MMMVMKRDEVTGEWRRLHNEELYALYLPNIVWVIRSRRIKWAGHVERTGKGEVHIWFWWGNRRERYHLKDLSVDGRIIIKWIFRKCDVGVWVGSSWHRIGTVGGHL
jgi:hypothetical protein